MQNTSDAYKEILSNPLRSAETRITIGGVCYTGPIFGLSVNGSLFSGQTPSIGNCVSRAIDLTIVPTFEIPKMAEINLEVRLVVKNPLTDAVVEASEWIPKGTFYIYRRMTDPVDGSLTIHGYDAMLKAEQVFLTETTEDDWPQPMVNVVNEIAEAMNVPIDPRTKLDSTFMAQYPLDYTMREILGYVAIAHGGNWIITDAGYLRLIGLSDIPDETYYMIDEDGDTLLFGDTRILI